MDQSALHQLGKCGILNTGKSSLLLQKYEKSPVSFDVFLFFCLVIFNILGKT